MEKKTKKNAGGVNPERVLEEMLGGEFDAKRVTVEALTFGIRPIRTKGGDVEQVVSVLPLGGGKSRDVFPILYRFRPLAKGPREIRCYVFPREVPERRKGRVVERGGEPVMKLIGHAIPIDLIGAARDGVWLPLGNTHIRVTFWEKESEREKGKKEYLALGPNGKIVIAVGFVPPVNKEVTVQVVEKANRFDARCIVPGDLEASVNDTEADRDAKSTALAVQAETIGAVVRAADDYMILVGNRAYDACQIIGLSVVATEAEIRKAYKELAATNHPDAKIRECREFTGSEPTADDKQEWNFSFSLIERSYKRMLLIRARAKAERKYGRAGRKADSEMPAQITVKLLAGRVKRTHTIIRRAFKDVGYDGVRNDTVVDREIAWVVVGYLNSPDFGNVDDTSAEADASGPASDKDIQMCLDVVAAAYRYKPDQKINCWTAQEIVLNLVSAVKEGKVATINGEDARTVLKEHFGIEVDKPTIRAQAANGKPGIRAKRLATPTAGAAK